MIVRSGIAIINAMMRVTARYLNAVDGIGFEGVDLLAHFHRADLGADAGADAPSHEEPGGQRARLADERNREAGWNHRLGTEALERGACMHRQHDADREAGGENQRRGAVPELKEMPEDFARLVGRTNGLDDGAPPKRGDRADEFKEAENTGTDTVDNRYV